MSPSRSNPALQEGNYDFPQPLKLKQEGIYDVPPPALSRTSPHSLYDFPPNTEAPPHHQHANANEGVYDVPPPALPSGAGPQTEVYDIPRAAQPSQHHRDGKQGLYDSPAQDAGAAADVADGVNRLSLSSSGSSRSSMSTSSSSTASEAADAAVQRLLRLQQAVELAVGALHSMAASPRWRTLPFMEHHARQVHAVLDRVRAALGDLVVFGRGAVATAAALSDPALHAKLRRQLGRLEDSQQILLQVYQVLESCGWAPNTLACSNQHKSDELERFVMVSRSVPDDAKQLASALASSAELLFRRTHPEGSSRGSTPEESRSHPLTCPASDSESSRGQKAFPASCSPDEDNVKKSEKCVRSWMEDYDYVHLQVHAPRCSQQRSEVTCPHLRVCSRRAKTTLSVSRRSCWTKRTS